MEPCCFKNYEQGDSYCYLDIKSDTGFFPAFAVGKWIQEVCDELYELIAKRSQQPTYYNKISFCTDGNEQNENSMLKFFNKDCINYAQKIRAKDAEGRIIGILKRKVIGRKTRNFAKKRRQITNLLHIAQTNHNFVEAESGETPAIREKIIDKALTWNDVFDVRLSIKI